MLTAISECFLFTDMDNPDDSECCVEKVRNLAGQASHNKMATGVDKMIKAEGSGAQKKVQRPPCALTADIFKKCIFFFALWTSLHTLLKYDTCRNRKKKYQALDSGLEVSVTRLALIETEQKVIQKCRA